jgi:phosphohistidine phosphatase
LFSYHNLILWRHAEAEYPESDVPDITRHLTEKGHRQAKKVASWLKQHLPKDTLILSSPAMRAVQTADALKREYYVIDALRPDAKLDDVIAVLQETVTPNILLIGHQPWMGQLITCLTHLPHRTSSPLKMASIKKSAVWWFEQSKMTSDDTPPYKLLAVQHPDFL